LQTISCIILEVLLLPPELFQECINGLNVAILISASFCSFSSLLQEAESKSELSQNISAREHFVFTDADGQVYHLTVEGNSVKDSARIPPDVSFKLLCNV